MRGHRAQRVGLYGSVVIFLLMQACQHPGEGSGVAMSQGQWVEADDPVASHTVSIMDPDPEIGQYCTAVVLDRDVLLTAAHCFNDTNRRAYALFSRAYNPKVGIKQQPVIKIRRIAVHAEYSRSRGDAYDAKIRNVERVEQVVSPGRPLYDIALAFLAEKIPDAYQPTPLAGGRVDFHNGVMTTAGYGCTSTLCRGTTNILRKFSMRFVRTFPEAGMIVLTAGAGQGACSGDSGGPDFIDEGGILRAFALVSTGPDACESGLSVDTLIEPYRGWIEQAISAVRSGRRGSSYTLTEF